MADNAYPTPAERAATFAAPIVDRRRFLQLAGGTAALAAMQQSITTAAAIPPNRATGSIRDVEHVVVLMQENRSFEHYLGTLRGVRGFGDPHPVTLPSGKSVWHQRGTGGEVLPFHPTVDDLGGAYLEGLPHGWNDGHQAINRGHYDRWIPAKGTTTMAYLERRDAAFHHALADAFTVCDAYYCSFIGSTDPNRYYLWSGWTGNDGAGGGPVVSNDELGYDWPTYPERLEQAGVSWKIYQDEGTGLDRAGNWGWVADPFIGNYGDNSLLYFNSYRNAQPGDPLFEKARRGTRQRDGQDYFELLRADVQADRLPQVSYIAAPEAFSEHSNWPTKFGAWYISKVLDALTSNPEVWSRTALFITYDENDGFFDHLVPPHANNPRIPGASTVSTEHEFFAGKETGSTYPPGGYGMGPRVPMFVVSPWSTGGYVCSETFDHTSVIRFIERRFGVAEPQVTPWRRAVAGDLTSAFDFGKTGTVPPLLDVSGWEPKDRSRHPSYRPVPPVTGSLPKQENGVRPARPLGYALEVIEKPGSSLSLTFRNTGTLGCFVQARILKPAGQPHAYTIGAGASLDVVLPASGDLAVELHGPNGFFRSYRGQLSGLAATLARQNPHKIIFDVRAPRGTSIEIADAQAGRTRSVVAKNELTKVDVDLRDSRGWYDLTLRIGEWSRGFAGHIENGSISISDPQLGR